MVQINEDGSHAGRCLESECSQCTNPDHPNHPSKQPDIQGKCGFLTDVYSRIVGYFTPTKIWNPGKKAEFKDRKTFDPEKAKRDIHREQAASTGGEDYREPTESSSALDDE